MKPHPHAISAPFPPRTRQLADEVARLAGRVLQAIDAVPLPATGTIGQPWCNLLTAQVALREALAAYLRTA